MTVVTKHLNISIKILPDQVEQDAIALRNKLVNIFTLSIQPFTELIAQLQQVHEQIKQIQNTIQTTKAASAGRDVGAAQMSQEIQKVNKELMSQQKIMEEAATTSTRHSQRKKKEMYESLNIEKDLHEYRLWQSKIMSEENLQIHKQNLEAQKKEALKAEEAKAKAEKERARVLKDLQEYQRWQAKEMAREETEIAKQKAREEIEIAKQKAKEISMIKKQQEKEFALMRSYKTTPYEFMPVNYIKPFVEKQLPYKHEIEKQLYANLSTAEKVIRMTQDRLRNGLLFGAAEDVKAYMDKMLNIAQQVSPKLRRQVASIFRQEGATEIIKEHVKAMSEIGKLSEIIGIKPNVIKGWNLATEDIKRLSLAFKNLKTDIDNVGIEKVSKFYKDVISQTVVKGSGRELGMLVKESDIENIQRLKKDIPEINTLLRQMGIETDKTHGKLGGLWASAKSYMKFQMGWFLGAGVIFSIIASIKQLAQGSLEFAQTLKNIQAVTGATSKELDMIASSAKKIATETPMAATEVAKLGLQLIRAGLSARDASAAMGVAAKVAVVSGEDAKVVADTIATAMMAWKLAADEAERVGNVIAAAMNYSRLTVQDLGTAFNYMASAAASFGMSLEETTAILAVYSNLGVRASTIATGWTQLMSELIAPSKKATEYITSLTNKTTGLKVSLSDVYPLTHSFAEILKVFEDAGFDAAKAFDIFQVRAGRAFMTARRAGSEAFVDMEKNIRESKQLSEGLARVMEGPIAAFKRFWNQLRVIAIDIGTIVLPVLIPLLDVISLLTSGIAGIVNLMTGTPGQLAIIAVALFNIGNALRYVTAGIATLTAINTVSFISNWLAWLAQIPAALASVTKGVGALRASLIALWAAIPGGLLGKGAVILGTAGLASLFGRDDSVGQQIIDKKNKIDELSKSIKSFNQVLAEGEESLSVYDQMFKEALNIDEYKNIEIPVDFQQWIDNHLKPAYEKIQRLRVEIKLLDEQLAKLNEKKNETASFWEVMKTGISEVINKILEFLGLLDKTGDKVYDLSNTLKELKAPKFVTDSLDKIAINLKKMTPENLTKDVKQVFTNTYEYFREIFLKRRNEKINEEIGTLTLNKNAAKEKLENTINEYRKLLNDKDIRKLIYDSLKNIEKMTPKEQEEKVVENIMRIIGLGAVRDPDMLKSIISTAVRTLREAREKIYKESAKKPTKDVVTEDISHHLKLLLQQIKNEQKLLRVSRDIAIDEADRTFEEQKKILERREKLNEEYYNLGLKIAKDYYDEKLKIIQESAEKEKEHLEKVFLENRKYLDAEIKAKKDALKEMQEDANKAIEHLLKRKLSIDDIMKVVTKERVGIGEITTLIFGKDTKTVTSEQKQILDKIMDFVKTIINLRNELGSLQIQAGKFTVDVENKAKEAIDSTTEAMIRQLKIQREIKEAQEPIQRQIESLSLQKEQNQALIEASELIGDWNTVQEEKIRLIENESKLQKLSNQLKIVELAILKKHATSPELTKFYELQIEYTKELIRLQEELSRIQKEREEKMKTVSGAIELALEDFEKSYSHTTQNIYDATTRLANNMVDAWAEFFDYSKEGWMDWGRLTKRILNDFINELYKVFVVQQLLSPIVRGISQGVMGLFSGGNLPAGSSIGVDPINRNIGHEGGLVTPYGIIPRYHYGGLSYDERLAILQTGEYVVSRRGVKALDRINSGDITQPEVNVVINMENKTGLPLQLKQRGTQTDDKTRAKAILLELMWTDPEIRNALAGRY